MFKMRGDLVWWAIALVVLSAIVKRFFWPTFSGWWFVVGITVVLLLSSIYVIPVIHYGLETLLDRRTGRVEKEGLRFTYPLIGTFELFRIEIETTPVPAFTSTSFDKLDMKVEGSVQWWPDRGNLQRFIEVGEDTIKKGLVDAVKARIGELAGRSTGSDFFRNRAALDLLLNCHLRLKPESQPDLRQRKYLKRDPDTGEFIYDLDKFMKDKTEIAQLHKLLSEEEEEKERSNLERLYGIVIKGFFLADVNFTDETRRALEAQRQRTYQMEGATAVMDWKREQAAALKRDLDLAPKDAIDTADITVEQVITEKGQEPRVRKQVFSVGDLGVVAELLRRIKLTIIGGKEE